MRGRGKLPNGIRYQIPYRSWIENYSLDYLEIQKRGKLCICCGTANVELDHIVPLVKDKNLSTTGRPYAGISPAGRAKDFEEGNLQFLCHSCNMSKGDSSVCRNHQKYLGIWNYLSTLDDMECLQ